MIRDSWLGLLALALLVFPGWLAAKATRTAQPLLAGFIGSAVTMVGLVLLLQAFSVRLTFGHCSALWVAVTLAIVGWRRQRIRSGDFSRPPPSTSQPAAWREHWPLLVSVVPAIAVVVYRAGTQALFGIDTIFRWNYLAEQMLARGTLAFYPPVGAPDYEIYAWPDGIAPAVSTLYFWVYGLARATRPGLTGPLVIFQFLLLIASVFALARRYFSDRAAAFAVALLAGSPVIAWSIAMGQETGLTALALIGLLLYLPRTRPEETTSTVVFASLAAGLGALAREYGLIYPVLGFVLIALRRLSWRAHLLFAAGVCLTVVPWYGRNWFRTGNPLFNLDVHGWFPVNREHGWLNESYQQEFGWANVPAGAGAYVWRNCFLVLLAGGAGALLYGKKIGALLGAAALITLLWVASVGYTAAGFTNSVRVLSPALALGAVVGGAACAHWIPGRRHLLGASIAVTFLAVDAALRALTLPGNVYKIPPSDWLAAGQAVHEYHARPIYAEFVRVANGQRILVLGPNALLSSRGARTVPLWSPEVRFLFDDALSPVESARRLRSAGIEFVLLNRGTANERYLGHSRFFRDPEASLRLIWADAEMVFHHVELPSTISPSVP